jgi:hypothetical protein
MCPMNPRLLRPIASNLDKDAATYLNAVAVADGQQLEPSVKKAVNDFVKGCKQDGIWDAMRSCGILAGARTLSGALVALKGSNPTNVGPFVSGDYARATGLKGNASNKYLNTNRNTNLDGQDDCHLAVYASAKNTGLAWYAGAGLVDTGTLHMLSNSSTELACRVRNSTDDFQAGYSANGLMGVSRSNSSNFVMRGGGASTTKTRDSQTPANRNYYIFFVDGAGSFLSDARLAFYSTGASLDLARLDTRVTALITSFAAL